MQGALVVAAEIQGTIKLWGDDNHIPYRGYSPSEIKKHATGKGNSGKPQMKTAAEAKWGNMDKKDDNEIDAMWLLDMVKVELGEK
jgi:Holliday junction resolvasome RuvABC endonuclease subunit